MAYDDTILCMLIKNQILNSRQVNIIFEANLRNPTTFRNGTTNYYPFNTLLANNKAHKISEDNVLKYLELNRLTPSNVEHILSQLTLGDKAMKLLLEKHQEYINIVGNVKHNVIDGDYVIDNMGSWDEEGLVYSPFDMLLNVNLEDFYNMQEVNRLGKLYSKFWQYISRIDKEMVINQIREAVDYINYYEKQAYDFRDEEGEDDDDELYYISADDVLEKYKLFL